MGWLILLSYLIQGLVLVFFPVPSEASSLQLLRAQRVPITAVNKNLLIILGTLGIVTFHLPLVFVLLPLVVPESLYIVSAPPGAGRLVVTAACLIAGSALSIVAVMSLRSRRRPPDAANSEQLLTEGIYAWCRHPVNLGLMLLMTGFFLAYPLWIMVPGTVAFFCNLHIRARLEENFLQDRYGDAYRTYKERVPMYGLPVRPK